ncbi:unnamed protein product [Rotaria sp. Silwood1]|nr:unnamed protein product [Rotaria sp. Silwood1]CAF4908201.1 unnamed protein product [Rotaria sp. Silwood1]
MKPAKTSRADEKPDHLKLSTLFRFIHSIIHAILLFLHEVNLLKDSNLPNRDYCQEHFEKDYELLGKLSNEPDQCCVWLFKVMNHLIDGNFLQKGLLNQHEKVIEFEQNIENQLIIPHIESIVEEIRKYKLAYKIFLQENDEQSLLNDLCNELIENEKEYPLLNFFNVTTINQVNTMKDFHRKLQLIPNVDKKYPMINFLIQRYHDYLNIQFLYPIVMFTNYLIEKLDYRITRKHASKKMISEILFNDSDYAIVSQLYSNFIHSWYKLKLNEIYLDSQVFKFEHSYPLEEFKHRTEIAKLLLNSSGDKQCILLLACLKTIAQLQNDIVQYFHKIMNKKHQPHAVPLQAVQEKDLLYLDKNFNSKILVDNALTINYHYGNGKDIIYDNEEIEFMLRDQICCLPLIDTERLHYLNYQFELYDRNTSLIADARQHVEQNLLPARQRDELTSLINDISNDDIFNYLGLLDYTFTYLHHFEHKHVEMLTIGKFIEKHIHFKMGINNNLIRDSILMTIYIEHIVDLYQLIEEVAFEKILRHNIEQHSSEMLVGPMNEQNNVIDQFIDMTSGKLTISSRLKDLCCWIRMLKRLLVRISMNINFILDDPLQIYVSRVDLWTVDVTTIDTDSFHIPDHIQLKHAFIILKRLETRRKYTEFRQHSNVSAQSFDSEQSSATTPI